MAGRVQLATTGTQDAYFTENPEYTHFIKQFKKHTNFSAYDVSHDLHGQLEYGGILKCTIPANAGDLIKTVRVHFTLPPLETDGTNFRYVESIGHAIFQHVDLVIGGQLVQRIPRDWLQIYSEHYVTQTKQNNLAKLIGKCPDESSGLPVRHASIDQHLPLATTSTSYIVDIPFYFHNNPELAIPLCALTNQECEIEIQLSDIGKCIHNLPNLQSVSSPDNTHFVVTVQPTADGNKFFINDERQPTLELQYGHTYTFEYGLVQNSNHPFKLSSGADGTHAIIPYAAYSDNQSTVTNFMNGSVILTFTVNSDTPSTLYYYCNSHPGMGGQINMNIAGIGDTSRFGIESMRLHTEMVQLNDPERQAIKKSNRDYIITQIQQDTFEIPVSSSEGMDDYTFKMDFTNPVKELYFVIANIPLQVNSFISTFDYDFVSQIYPPGSSGKYVNFEHLISLGMVLDNETILDEVTGNVVHLRAVQSGIHHSRTQLFRRFYSYSFALEPEKWYPTGQRNFSAIKEQIINLKLNSETTFKRELRVYALANNILRINGGSGKVIFPNGGISN
jgi:plastocyanin